MAWIIGYVSQEQADELRARDWEVEPAERYNLIGDVSHYLLQGPPDGEVAVAIWVDTDVMQVFDGPDWDHAGESEEGRQFLALAPHIEDLGVADDVAGEIYDLKKSEAAKLCESDVRKALAYMLRVGGLDYVKRFFKDELEKIG